jgi:hypothetical protein
MHFHLIARLEPEDGCILPLAQNVRGGVEAIPEYLVGLDAQNKLPRGAVVTLE